MTDNEIIKALECCIDCNCKACPCCRIIDGGTHCTEIDEEQILALINRQKAEIEELQHKIVSCNSEIERLQGRVKSVEYSKQCLLECFKTAKSEARKEFVEGWHTALEEARTKFAYEPIIVRNAIEVVIAVTDNLLKEMESD